MAVDTGANEQPCPDPSAHAHSNRLSAQASTAALYVTNPERAASQKAAPRESVLGPDGKLSSKGAAASLKYAKPQDLPSFPSAGGSTSSAGAAAVLAKDYKMKDLWHPETSSAGSAAAAIAHRDGGRLDLWQPSASAAGNSAAVLAMRNKGLSPQLDRGYTKTGQSNALLAATMSQKNTRQRAGSTPSPAPALYPDQANSAYNALNAATVSHRGSVRSPPRPKEETGGQGFNSAAMQAARVHNIGANVNPEMWGERPPVEIEEEERKHKAALRASAISMAKQMYDYQNRTVLGPEPSGNAGAEAAMARTSTSTAPPDLKQEALRYIHLQDAAQKLAQERLAQVDKNLESAKYREYYGYGDKPQRSRLSMRGRNRRRASSEGNQDPDDSSDEEGARRVRGQMNQFSTALADIDAKKQSTDRKALLAAAERNVNKSMNSMDDRVFQETGKVSQSKMDEWAAKARKKAEEESALRTENHGKMHIGGGKFMEQAEIERIAQARLQPTLDEINVTAERKRAHDEEVRLEKEEQDRLKRDEKLKHREEKDELKKVKNEEKAAARKEKEERRAAENERKMNDKAEQRKSMGAEDEKKSGERKSFLSRLASKRKSRDVKKDDAPPAAATTAAGTGAATTTTTENTEIKPSTSEPDRTASDPVESKEEATEPIETKEDAAPPALERTHTGNYTDAVPATATATRGSKKPDLERHISKIQDSSSESEWSESDQEEEADKHTDVPIAAAGSSGAAAAPDHDAAHAKEVADRVVSNPPTTTTTTTTTSNPKTNPPTQDEAPISTTSAPDPSTTTAGPRPSTASSHPSSDSTQPKGFRGFISKLRGKPAAPERTTSTTVENRAPTISGTPAIASTTPTPAPPQDAKRSLSSSSFTRHDAAEADVSSLSSSGREEEDFKGRGYGRGKRMAGLGGKERLGEDEDEESDQFEEARDHFDEGLAPKPAFAGQAKSQSPGRGTRFHEEV